MPVGNLPSSNRLPLGDAGVAGARSSPLSWGARMRDTLTLWLKQAAFGGIVLALLVNLAVLIYGVVARYLFGNSPFWMDELSRFLIIGTVMLGAGAVWVEGLHMRVAVIEHVLSNPVARLLNAYQWLLTVGLSGYAAWVSWEYAWSVSRFITQGLGVSRTVPLLALPLGFGLLCVHALLYGPRPLPESLVEDA